ncbi:MAG: diaminopimelate epimerase [Wenzhouxiangella sp.]|nr:diaminopimelate epimerase [Wenzhouxiangella sp.]TVR96942.1 MAG: diaminopimelate epimerase [Wenzhouxiangellaceae bacterium]
MKPDSRLVFSKLEALGNDFVLIDARTQPFSPSSDWLRRLANRRLGVGCDQILVLITAEHTGAACRVRIHNADGSLAEQCGNGMRAVALWLHERGELGESTSLQTDGGLVVVRRSDDGQFSVSLAEPAFASDAWGSATSPDQWTEQIDGGAYPVRGVSMGNPHLVLRLKAAADADLVVRLGEHFQGHPALPQGANINLAFGETRNRISLRVNERGVGPTPACGSGACATAVAYIHDGLADSPVSVIQPGGELVIHWPGVGESVTMTGPARHVFDGFLEPWTPSIR